METPEWKFYGYAIFFLIIYFTCMMTGNNDRKWHFCFSVHDKRVKESGRILGTLILDREIMDFEYFLKRFWILPFWTLGIRDTQLATILGRDSSYFSEFLRVFLDGGIRTSIKERGVVNLFFFFEKIYFRTFWTRPYFFVNNTFFLIARP